MKGILGQKIGMTSVFSEQGNNIPVTIIKAIPNVVSNVLTKEKNGYQALQLSAFDRRDKTISKSVLGHLQKAKTNAKYFIKEIREMKNFKLGDIVDLSIFTAGQFVDVTAVSKGKGFAGAIKRHNQKIGPKSHGGGGGSKPVRLTGGLGDVVSNRVFKGRTMPGHMGHIQKTLQNLEIIFLDIKNHLMLVKGSIPGPNKSFVIVKNAIKKTTNKDAIKLVFYENTKSEKIVKTSTTVIDNKFKFSDAKSKVKKANHQSTKKKIVKNDKKQTLKKVNNKVKKKLKTKEGSKR